MNLLPDMWSGFILGMAVETSRPGARLAGWRPFTAGAAAGSLFAGILAGRWDEAGFSAAALAVLAWDWWNRKGKRAAKAAGAKSRALLAAIVVKAREAGTPLPEGARALCQARSASFWSFSQSAYEMSTARFSPFRVMTVGSCMKWAASMRWPSCSLSSRVPISFGSMAVEYVRYTLYTRYRRH